MCCHLYSLDLPLRFPHIAASDDAVVPTRDDDEADSDEEWKDIKTRAAALQSSSAPRGESRAVRGGGVCELRV